MTRGGCVVELGDAARALRRFLGPVAWAVLEDVATEVQPDDADCVVETNVRRVATNVGISKDTAARALRRLINAGLVTRATSGRGERGAFATVTYELHLDGATGLTIDRRSTTERPATPSDVMSPSVLDAPASARRRSREVTAAQASLFDELAG